MGFNVSLLTIADKRPETIFSELKLTPTAVREEIPESAVIGALLPDDRYALWLNTRSAGSLNEQELAKLSRGASLLVCELSETTMNSSLVAWEDGKEVWSVWHDGGDQCVEHLGLNGTLIFLYPEPSCLPGTGSTTGRSRRRRFPDAWREWWGGRRSGFPNPGRTSSWVGRL
jgi:hypothetical protein